MTVGTERIWELDPVVRQARQDGWRSAVRSVIAIIVSGFLFAFVDALTGIVWLAFALAVEAAGLFIRHRLRAGVLSFRVAYVPLLVASSLSWVALAAILWGQPSEVARMAAVICLFTVSLYAAAGGMTDRRLIFALLGPALVGLLALVVSDVWAKYTWSVALLTSVATFGTCGVIVQNAILLSAKDAQLLKAAAELEAAGRAKDAFLADVSHEIRTPLNGVLALAGALERTSLDPRQQDMVRLIRSSGETMRRLLSSLLDLSKAEIGALALEAKPFDLAHAVEAAAKPMQPMAEAKKLNFEIVIAPEARVVVVGDALRLRQIVANLTSNAVKFTEAGHVRVTVGAEPTPDGRTRVEIAVCDTGPGLSEALRESLFKRFSQVKPGSGEVGSGLGLAISQALAQLMGGEIEVRSLVGVGSQFVFSAVFEISAAPEALERPVEFDPDAPSKPVDSGLRVLLADDHAVNRRAVELILEPFGAEVVSTVDGASCVEAFLIGAFDVILMDKRMPGMDGLDATRAIRALEAEHGRTSTPILMLSADAGDEARAAALAAGCDAHVPKPITPEVLIGALQSVLTDRA